MRSAFVAVLVTLGITASVAACQCGSRAIAEEVVRSRAIFVGRVVEIKDQLTPFRRTWLWLRIKYAHLTAQYRDPEFTAADWGFAIRFKVSRTWKGSVPHHVWLITGRSGIVQRGGDCGYPFQKGETYLVFVTSRSKFEGSDVNVCSRTSPVRSAAADIAYLGPGSHVPPN